MKDDFNTQEYENETTNVQSTIAHLLCEATVKAVKDENNYIGIYASTITDYELDNFYFITFHSEEERDAVNAERDKELLITREVDGELIVDCVDMLHNNIKQLSKCPNRVRGKLLEALYSGQIDLLESELEKRYLPKHLQERMEEIPFMPDEKTIQKYVEIENGNAQVIEDEFGIKI